MKTVPTIRDVAKRAGVAVSTASLALNGKPGVSAETRARVLKAAIELDYHPHATAKNLADGRTRTIGIITPITLEHLFSSAGFFMKLFKGLHRAVGEEGYVLSLYITETDEEASVNIRTLARSRAVDGLIITNPTLSSPYLGELKRLHIPYVFIGRPVGKAPYVDSDNVSVGYLATKHLILHGHKKIAVLCGPERFTFSKDRLRGYRRALNEAGIRCERGFIWRSELVEDDAYRVVLRQVKATNGRITALFTVSDVQAAGAIRALRDLGLGVPEDVAVVCVNNTSLTQHFSPPLTTIELNEERLGFEAARLLLRLIHRDSAPPVPVLVPVELKVRRSCGCTSTREGG